MYKSVESSSKGGADVVDQAELNALREELLALRMHVLQHGAARLQAFLQQAKLTQPSPSLCNLAHYLAFRELDLRPLQARLAEQGLSSLGHLEGHVLASLNQVLAVIDQALGREETQAISLEGAPDPATAQALLTQHTQALFGMSNQIDKVRIMVTLPSEAADDPQLLEAMLRAGMDCARINCAHDTPERWRRMAAQVREASQRTGLACRVYVDLPGPKLRTAPLPPGPPVLALHPERDAYGRITGPARVMLVASDMRSAHPPALPISDSMLSQLQPKDVLRFTDTRNKRRELIVIDIPSAGVAHCESWQPAYVLAGTAFVHKRDRRVIARGQFDNFEGKPGYLLLHSGDRLRLGQSAEEGLPAVGLSHPEVLSQLAPGQRILFDDGKIGAVVEAVDAQGAIVRITRARAKGEKLRGGKGINLPDTDLQLTLPTADDLPALDFAATQADIVGISFVRTPIDLDAVLEELDRRGATQVPVVAKIETRQGVKNLPQILLSGIARHPFGVMIARGDLAVEIGPVRLAEIQEEILWLCEAGHAPVVWATQVLESLAKKGLATRAEVTDAAMAVRAECVMLNKGPYIIEAIATLREVLGRMQAHQHKKFSELRALHW